MTLPNTLMQKVRDEMESPTIGMNFVEENTRPKDAGADDR